MRRSLRFPPSILLGVFVVGCMLVSAGRSEAAQYRGDARQFPQPDGTLVEVRLYGTELYMRAESPDGYTLIKDPSTGFICYAELAADGDLRSTGLVYRGVAGADSLRLLAQRGIAQGVRPSSAKVSSIVQATRQSLGQRTASSAAGVETALAEVAFSKYKPTLGSGKGLVVLVDFSDRPQSIPVSEYDNAFNGDTYDSLGSVRTWIERISYSKYTASHTIAGPMRAAYPTSHYVGGAQFDYSASQELMKQVFAYIDDNIDLTSYATNGAMPSLVVIYPGAEVASQWATGLWPHSGEGGYTTSEKVRIPNALISNGGTKTPMSLETFRHELGHSLFTWPDTYDYDDDSLSAGGYATETTLPCAPFRMWAGWLNVTDVVGLNEILSLAANGDTCVRYQNASNASEYFVVEYMKKDTVYRADAPDEGLLVWHVDEKGDNSLQDMTPTKHYELSVEQADGLFDLEKNKNSHANDLYHAGNKDRFDDTTTPNSKWWNGSASGFAVCNVGALDPTMNVTVGCSGTITPVVDAGAGGAAGSGGAAGASAGSGGRSGTGGMAGSGGGTGGRTGARDAGADAQGKDGASPDLSLDLAGQGRGGSGAGGTSADARSTSGGAGGQSGSAGGATAAGGAGASGAAGSAGTQGKGGSAAGGAGGTSAQAQAANSGGCSCRIGDASSGTTAAWMTALLLALVVRRRRNGKR